MVVGSLGGVELWGLGGSELVGVEVGAEGVDGGGEAEQLAALGGEPGDDGL